MRESVGESAQEQMKGTFVTKGRDGWEGYAAACCSQGREVFKWGSGQDMASDWHATNTKISGHERPEASHQRVEGARRFRSVVSLKN
jgi:hypothetical protein